MLVLRQFLELEADTLHTGGGHQCRVLVKYEAQTPSISGSRVEKPRFCVDKKGSLIVRFGVRKWSIFERF